MKFEFKLLNSTKEIESKILYALLKPSSASMMNSIKKLKLELPLLVTRVIENSPEYSSISNGKLRYELGIDNADSKLAKLVSVWSSNIEYAYNAPTIVGNSIKSSFSANMIRVDFADVLYSDFANVIDSVRGYSLPWLEWLLLEGNRTIIQNHEVIFGSNKRSRTGLAVMRKSTSSWKVPSEFAGTQNDNWITRALDSASADIQKLLDGLFT